MNCTYYTPVRHQSQVQDTGQMYNIVAYTTNSAYLTVGTFLKICYDEYRIQKGGDNMQKYQYHIILRVPLGKRHGEMMVQIEENQISGDLFVLGKKFPLSGAIDEQGNCRIIGKFCSPKQEYCYEATGTFDSAKIQLLLSVGYRKFQLTGTAWNGEEG